MSIYDINGWQKYTPYNKEGSAVSTAYDYQENTVFPTLPIPTGTLNAVITRLLPDIYNNGHGWTCTGLAYDSINDVFLVGDIGKTLPSSPGYASVIRVVNKSFTSVVYTINLYTVFTSMQDVQGITLDSNGNIWFCSNGENLVRQIDPDGNSMSSFSVSNPTGIAYDPEDDTLWVLTYSAANNIQKRTKTGTVKEQYTFNYEDTLDQCFYDPERKYLYITAGENYSSRNNVYLFNTVSHSQSITCTVDSYSVEGLSIVGTELFILNDGYYHSALDNRNVVNIYNV